MISRDDAQIRARIDGEEIEAQLDPAATGAIIRIGDHSTRYFAARQRDTILIALGPAQFEFAPSESDCSPPEQHFDSANDLRADARQSAQDPR